MKLGSKTKDMQECKVWYLLMRDCSTQEKKKRIKLNLTQFLFSHLEVDYDTYIKKYALYKTYDDN